MRYETCSREAQALLSRHGPGPYWISVNLYLESPLPDWALAALLGGEQVHGTRRFPRFLFGHELLHIRRANYQEYIPIGLRAVLEFAAANSHTKAVVSELIRQYRATLPHVFGGFNTHIGVRVEDATSNRTNASRANTTRQGAAGGSGHGTA